MLILFYVYKVSLHSPYKNETSATKSENHQPWHAALIAGIHPNEHDTSNVDPKLGASIEVLDRHSSAV
jgi:hypothetical protein